ncbi:MAG TPA: hypothetical protein VHL55_02970 [Acidimicrobiia bacterium]|nr:hypothetical protein [Acidimicrobiia bacterium]
MTAPQVLLRRLIDYAGMYPPESLGLEDAVDTYLGHRRGTHEWMLGPFLCPSSGICDLEWLLDRGPIPVGVVLDQPAAEAIDSISASDLAIRQIETTDLEIGLLLEKLDPSVTVWLEAEPRSVQTLAARHPGRRIGVKTRCGGATPEMFPTPSVLATAMHETFTCGLPLKATAGLHHPWRHFSPEVGTWRHGFLNLAAAATALVLGSDLNRVEEILATEQPGVLARDHLRISGHEFSVADLKSARVFFRSYGSCSFDEPVEDLAAMGSLWGAR